MYAHQREVIFVNFDPFSGLSSEDDSSIALHKMGTIGGHGVYGQYAQEMFLSDRRHWYGLQFSLKVNPNPPPRPQKIDTPGISVAKSISRRFQASGGFGFGPLGS